MKHIYLNNAFGAFPPVPGVIEAITESLQHPPRISGRDAESSSDSIGQCREKIAQILGVAGSQVVLTPGATYGLNTALLGLGLKRGDFVISTVMEHNSVLRPLAHLENSLGIKVEYIQLSKGKACLDEAEYDLLLGAKPRLVVMIHASNVTGRINQISSLFKKAKSAGATTLLDASQTVGRISVKPNELHADIVAFSGYKGLRGPMGTGALYVASEIELRPAFVGGTGVKSDLRLQPTEMPMRLEAGTHNVHGFAGLDAAMSCYIKYIDDIAAKERIITQNLLSGLAAVPNVRVFDNDPSGDRLPIVSFSIRGMDAETAGFALYKSFGIECRAGLHCAPLMHKALGATSNGGTIRFSPSYINTQEDIDYAIKAVGRLAE